MKYVYWGGNGQGKSTIFKLIYKNDLKLFKLKQSRRGVYNFLFDKDLYFRKICCELQSLPSTGFDALKVEFNSTYRNNIITRTKYYDNLKFNVPITFSEIVSNSKIEWCDLFLEPIMISHPEDCIPYLIESDWIVSPFILIGYSSWKLDQPFHQDQRLLDILKTKINVVPFNSNKVEVYLHRLLDFDMKKSKYDNFYEVYEKDRDVLYKFLDKYEKAFSSIRKCLVDLDIKYELFDLDKNEYNRYFNNVTEPLLPRFDLDNKDQLIAYNKLKHISEEYLLSRGLL